MNVIVICLDTLRWDHLGCYGNDWIRTPAIDGFAKRATRFDAAYCASFPTVPMRTDAFTGDVHWPRYGWKNLGDDETTVVQVLEEAGYRTALILDTANMVGAHLDRDFGECHLIQKQVDDGITPDDIVFPFPREHARQNGVLYARQMANLSHHRHEVDWAVAQTMLKAGEWLEDHHREDFFLWVDTFEIHEVWHTPPYFVDLYGPCYEGVDYSYPNYGSADLYSDLQLRHMRARYAAEVTLTDKWVGLLLRQIEEMGLFANSLVMLLSDHGMYLGEHGRVGKHTVDATDPWPLFDEVARLALLVSTPGKRVRSAIPALVQPADIVPTILGFCGVTGPRTYGRSWLPLLAGERQKHWDYVFSSCFSWDGPGSIDFLTSLISVIGEERLLVTGPQPHAPKLCGRGYSTGSVDARSEGAPEEVERMRQALARFMRDKGAEEGYVRACALGQGEGRRPRDAGSEGSSFLDKVPA
jgi:arylsulfatase A-like enzyme